MVNLHTISIRWSAEDSAFIAEVSELPGCMAHGGSRADALKNAEDAIALWIDTALKFGDPLPDNADRESRPAHSL